jgi:hypothetical protein
VAKYAFLSDDWFVEVRRIQASHTDVVPPEVELRMNLVITETPFDGDKSMHMVTLGGQADWGEGHLGEVDVTLTLGYLTAKEIFVGGNPAAAIEAFLTGRIILQGDLTKLMAMQAAQPGAGALSLAAALLDVTE